MVYKRSRSAFEADAQAPYVFYGTSLPPIDSETRDDESYVPIWKQEVRDERGRKRLHGAFTGGFSAGYFNTVGSKEGWTPSTFTSSRSNRNASKAQTAPQRPEDFMDEEDLADAAEARQVYTEGSFATLGGTTSGSPVQDPFAGLVKSTMGVRLLQKMGWRVGQGIGPRVRRKARLDEAAGGPPGEGNDDTETFLFAPDNPPLVAFSKKVDQRGLGFEPAPHLSKQGTTDASDDDDSSNILGLRQKISRVRPKAPTKKGGFGVGVLNDTGSDEEDPYEMGPKIAYNRTLGSEKKMKQGKKKAGIGYANPLLATTPVFKKGSDRKGAATPSKCHDGRPPLEGFVLASNINSQTSAGLFKPPQIPPGWKSSRSQSQHGFPATAQSSVSRDAKNGALDPKVRGAALGEAPLPGKSVFDYLTPEARDRIAAASGRKDLPPGKGELPPPAFRKSSNEIQNDLWKKVPPLDKGTATVALERGASGWMPYAEDEAKRARYRAFLELSAGLRDDLPERAPGTSVTDWERELREFARAATVFKPVTGLMASRFTSSSSSPSLASDNMKAEAAASPLQTSQKIQGTPAEEAARLGMYGPMTRSVQEFAPSRLLCKRFNVKPPSNAQDATSRAAGDGTVPGAAGRASGIMSTSSMDELLKEVAAQKASSVGCDASTSTATSPPPIPQREAVIDLEKNDAIEADRAGDAVFRAVFGSDDEDDDS